MRSRLLSNDKIDDYVNRLTTSVHESKLENEKMIAWELFFDEQYIKGITTNHLNTGAIALAILTLCSSSKRDTKYKSTIKSALNQLIELRNPDGSWSETTNKNNNQGIIYNSIVSIQSLISAGFLDINNTNPNLLSQHLNYIFESLRWIYSQRIAKSSQYYGWGYSGDTKKEIYIMPTVHVLVTFKQVYYKLLFNWKRQIDTVVDDNKSLLNIINEIQNSLLYFRISPESGWGKTIDETDERMVYTLLCLYGLSYSEIATPEINSPEEKLTVADINLFAKKLCNWRKRGLFNTEIINSLLPEEFFDSYIQMTSQGTKNNIVDHETFFETITLLSILEYIKRYKGQIKKQYHSQLFMIITKTSVLLTNRIQNKNINNKSFIVVRSRRGLLSQSYPIYAIYDCVTALLLIKKERENIISLMNHRGRMLKVVSVIIQVIALYFINAVAIPNANIWMLLLISLIAPLSEYIKNWILKLSKVEN